MKKLLLQFFFCCLLSCNNLVEEKKLKNLSSPCEFIDVKLEIYENISMLYDKYADRNNKGYTDDYRAVEMVDFSKLMKLWQKNDEIDFYIGLNDWNQMIKSCPNYYIIDSLQEKMNI